MRAGDGGQLLGVPVGRRGRPGPGDPQRGGVPAGGRLDDPVGDRVLDVEPEIAGEGGAAGGPVGDQPPAHRQGEERLGDHLASTLDVGLAGADDLVAGAACLAGRVWS